MKKNGKGAYPNRPCKTGWRLGQEFQNSTSRSETPLFEKESDLSKKVGQWVPIGTDLARQGDL
jgi:hypothetical protein